MLQATRIELYFAQFPTLKIQLRDVLTGHKSPTPRTLEICEMPHDFNIMAL